jgi:hypothetical protein
MVLVGLLAMFVLAGCLVGPGPRGAGVVVVPALPPIVVLEEEPYYNQSGYFYYYRDNRWSYSHSRSGPWVELPKDRYPKEVRFKSRGDDKDRGEKRGHDEHERE